MHFQYEILAKLLVKKSGVTSSEIANALPSVSPHRRLTDMKQMGWVILKKKNDGENFYHYFGTPPETSTGNKKQK